MVYDVRHEYDPRLREFVEVWSYWDAAAMRRVTIARLGRIDISVIHRSPISDDSQALLSAARTMAKSAEAAVAALSEFARVIGSSVGAIQALADISPNRRSWGQVPDLPRRPRYDPRHLAGWPNYADASPPEGSQWTPWGYTGMPSGWHGKGGAL